MEKPKTAIEMIEDERKRQKDIEGWTLDHDDCHRDGELAMAAACYAAAPTNLYLHSKAYTNKHEFIELWPWNPSWDKREKHNTIKRLTIAGALIVAEIERLQRKNGEIE